MKGLKKHCNNATILARFLALILSAALALGLASCENASNNPALLAALGTPPVTNPSAPTTGGGTETPTSSSRTTNYGSKAPSQEKAVGDIIFTDVSAEPYSDDRDVVLVDLAGRGRVWVRFPEPGDRMRPFGLGGHAKKLSDLLVDAKVPRRKRPLVPVVCTDDRPDADVVWLAGIRLDERFKVTPHTARRVQLGLHRR